MRRNGERVGIEERRIRKCLEEVLELMRRRYKGIGGAREVESVAEEEEARREEGE